MTLLALLACTPESELSWVRFNADEAEMTVEVTAVETLGDAVTTELLSTTGSIVVGAAETVPGSGPVGTDHRITVMIDNDYEEVVGRVTIEADAGDRGVTDMELRQDSADHGYWVGDITSLGEEGEERTDRFRVQLWNLQEIDTSDVLEEAPSEAE